jgi:death on curing protein
VDYNFPTFDQIVLANSRLVARYGGSGHQVANGGPLHFALYVITGPIFGVDRFPTLEEKACRLASGIATNHVFHDGNKRTAVSALDMLLEANGHALQAGEQELADAMEGLAAHGLTFEEFVTWVRARINPPVT